MLLFKWWREQSGRECSSSTGTPRQRLGNCVRNPTGTIMQRRRRKCSVYGQGGQASGDGQASTGRRSRGAGSFARRPQHRVRKIGGVEEGGISDPAQMEADSSTDRIQQLEAMVAELRRDDLRSHSAASKRAGEVAADPTVLVPEAHEELLQWITSTSARMLMAMEREDSALVAELSAQLAAGMMKLASAKRRCNPGSRYGLRGVRVCEASNTGPRSTSRFSQAVSVRGVTVTVPNLCRIQAHHQAQRMILRLSRSRAGSRTVVSCLSCPRGGVDEVDDGRVLRQPLGFHFRPTDLLFMMLRSEAGVAHLGQAHA